MGITNDEDTPPNKNPVSKETKIEKPLIHITKKIIMVDIKKLKIVNTKLCENSRINEERLMLNAPSNKRKSKVNVVNTGATLATDSGVT